MIWEACWLRRGWRRGPRNSSRETLHASDQCLLRHNHLAHEFLVLLRCLQLYDMHLVHKPLSDQRRLGHRLSQLFVARVAWESSSESSGGLSLARNSCLAITAAFFSCRPFFFTRLFGVLAATRTIEDGR